MHALKTSKQNMKIMIWSDSTIRQALSNLEVSALIPSCFAIMQQHIGKFFTYAADREHINWYEPIAVTI